VRQTGRAICDEKDVPNSDWGDQKKNPLQVRREPKTALNGQKRSRKAGGAERRLQERGTEDGASQMSSQRKVSEGFSKRAAECKNGTLELKGGRVMNAKGR